MTKKEFLDELTESLAGNVPSDVIADNINYYKNYIESSASVEDALEELGDPHLIARTIIDSFMASKGPMADYYVEQARNEYSNGSYDNVNYNTNDNPSDYETNNYSLKWYEKLVGILIVVAVAAMLLLLGAVAVKIIIRVILPIVIVLLAVRFIADNFRKD